MKVVHAVKAMHAWRRSITPQKTVAFVPTMGSLHAGHLSLVKEAAKLADEVVVSIFVNPAQFAAHEDLDRYPRTLDADTALLAGLKEPKLSTLFAPSVADMYPSGITQQINAQRGTFVAVEGLSHQLEGSIRPHFFRGVATVVTKLLHVVSPHLLLLGQKDAQQCVVLEQMCKDLLFDTAVHIVPTAREPDGVAMSSRNVFLTPEERQMAPVLYKALRAAADALSTGSATTGDQVTTVAKMLITNEAPMMDIQYIKLNHATHLDEVASETLQSQSRYLLSAAIKTPSGVRLIDNLPLCT